MAETSVFELGRTQVILLNHDICAIFILYWKLKLENCNTESCMQVVKVILYKWVNTGAVEQLIVLIAR